ncbi:MAG: metallophosphoesterase family protein [Solobacterium sp.]|nr:metallophosphoesterase family protein [Solobacterium sp.]
MKILAVADEEAPYLYDYYNPRRTEGVDFIIGCGDLKASYLEFLTTVVNKPVFYVCGNHDTGYEKKAPEGCICIDGTVAEYKGLRIAGLGGSRKYKPNAPYMYTEKEMMRRIRALKPYIKAFGGVDILVTHAPAEGYGDMEDLPHRGFECFNSFLDEYKPEYMLHGHVHKQYGDFVRQREHESGTTIINCYESAVIEIDNDKIGTVSEKTKRKVRFLRLLSRKRNEGL